MPNYAAVHALASSTLQLLRPKLDNGAAEAVREEVLAVVEQEFATFKLKEQQLERERQQAADEAAKQQCWRKINSHCFDYYARFIIILHYAVDEIKHRKELEKQTTSTVRRRFASGSEGLRKACRALLLDGIVKATASFSHDTTLVFDPSLKANAEHAVGSASAATNGISNPKSAELLDALVNGTPATAVDFSMLAQSQLLALLIMYPYELEHYCATQELKALTTCNLDLRRPFSDYFFGKHDSLSAYWRQYREPKDQVLLCVAVCFDALDHTVKQLLRARNQPLPVTQDKSVAAAEEQPQEAARNGFTPG